jgi:3-deoxy-7-phosphoheptulonate synthase
VHINGHVVGEKNLAIIGGPCAVESFEQCLEAGKRVKAAGGVAMRGGAFKPRTSPYSFQGLGEKGLEILAAVRKQIGLPVVTEVLSVQDVGLVADYADVLQVGTRNMQNFTLLEELGRTGKPVVLKRGTCATIEEFLLAAEYVLRSGNSGVILCLRGIRTFENQTRYTLSIGALAYLKQVTHLPVIVDPSHPAGQRSLVPPLAKAAIAAGADGLLVETHPDPENAQVDGAQSLTLDGFDDLLDELRPIAQATGRDIPKGEN